SSSHLFWTYEKDKGLTSFNKNYSDAIFDLYGKKVTIKEGLKTRPQPVKKELLSFWDEKYNEALSGQQVEFITSRTNKNGNRIVREVFLNPIYDENNNVNEVSGIAHDITEKTLAEEQLKESLKEKEVLLKEVHHRVKNNLQVISSILNLQSSYVTEESTLNILRESQNRIKSMAFIHESLYQTNDFSQINFSEYVVSLSQNLVHSYEVFDNFVNLNLQVKDVSLNLDQSIPCGLLINELISNALKYAFPKNKKGTITIDLFEKDKMVFLNIKDDGVGLPENIDYRDTGTLGLQLVITLTEQLGGKIELDNTKGANYSLTFKKD
ncbi:MAG: histidine kinase dimerization/phosphoacceptor domain -containing protein, partial [Vicingaceae bacterium]|nr:histidine kinase dimerization/phosphoacceptor domain -containing protein [Vicingaceae bacterium]